MSEQTSRSTSGIAGRAGTVNDPLPVPTFPSGTHASGTADTFGDQPGMASKATAAADIAEQTADTVVNQTAVKAAAGVAKAAGGLETLADTIREQSRSSQRGEHGPGVQGAATMAADGLEMTARFLREQDTEQLIQQVENFIRRKPMESALIAASIGFFLAKAIR